jgi:hypothetical protein
LYAETVPQGTYTGIEYDPLLKAYSPIVGGVVASQVMEVREQL